MDISSSQMKGRVSNTSDRLIQNSKEKEEYKQKKSRHRGAKHGSRSTRSVAFRLLCHESKVGSVIGKSGSIIKQLEQNTGAKIRVENPVPSCGYHVVLVVGSAKPKKKITIDGGSDVYKVSSAQEALISVVEKVMESNDISESKNSVSCRLIIQASNVESVLGKEGKVIERIGQECGVKTRILTADQMPACVSTPDELIQIMGDVLSVKKALLAVSCCLLKSYSVGIDKIYPLSKRKPHQEVSFRLCCSNNRIGGIIGKSGSIVNALENDTGASIKVGPNVSGSEERVITVSALESPSPSQQAVDLVFARLVEVGIKKELDSSSDKALQTSVRLLVPSNQIGCLVGKGDTVIDEMRRAFGTKIQILGGSHVPKCAVEKEKVCQISGDYQKVSDALFHVTSRLRDNMFSSKRINGTRGESTGKLVSQTVVDNGNLSVDSSDSGSESTASEHDIEFESGNTSAIVTRTTLEILVPSHSIGSIYGESGRNLDQIKQISGAEVTICDAKFGTKEGKVIISGTPDQAQVAQSLLQTFILSTPKTHQFISS